MEDKPEKKKEKIIRTLECKLLATEVMRKSERLAEMEEEIARVERKKAAISKRYAGQIETLRMERAELSKAIINRSEMRPIECREVLDRFRSEVILLRNDTDEEVQRRPMTYDEKQGSLFDDLEEIDIPEPPAAEAAPDPQPEAEADAPPEEGDEFAGITEIEAADDFTAEQCQKCHRIDGAHDDQCSLSASALGEGTPIETEVDDATLEAMDACWCTDKINQKKSVPFYQHEAGPLIVTGTVSKDGMLQQVIAWPVLPLANCPDRPKAVYNPTTGYLNVRVKYKRETWVIVGPKLTFTRKEEAKGQAA